MVVMYQPSEPTPVVMMVLATPGLSVEVMVVSVTKDDVVVPPLMMVVYILLL